eukprot:1104201-Pelagomonas_calceolata.AAC.1
MQLIPYVDMCTHQTVSAVTLLEALLDRILRTEVQSDAVLKLSALHVETQKHLLPQLSCPCRQ